SPFSKSEIKILLCQSRSLNDDLLSPYPAYHSPVHSPRTTRDIHPLLHNNTYLTYNAHSSENLFPVTDTRYFVSDIALNQWSTYNKNHVYGHVTTIYNPSKTFSVLEATHGGCQDNQLDTAVNAARRGQCFVAQNGGYFNTKTQSCLGNVISRGRMLHTTDAINAHFGILSNGSIVVGYISDADLRQMNFKSYYYIIIFGISGTSFVEESVSMESSDTEETGTLRYFSDVQSARTAIGHDKHGRVVLVQVDGQTGARGVNLKSFAKFLIEELHLVNAINLDGGGSATLVINGTLANTPSDHCKGHPQWRCARAISTIVCAHSPICDQHCENGECINGRCQCNENYVGSSCNVLSCGKHNCSDHGHCTASGCVCNAGWSSTACDIPCNGTMYGRNCTQECRCSKHGVCDPVNGDCDCKAGFHGDTCSTVCPPWKYGKNCQFQCHCGESCFCDAVTGKCGSYNDSRTQEIAEVASCIESKDNKNKQQVVYEGLSNEELYSRLLSLICTISLLLIISMCVNFILLWQRHISNKVEQEVEEYEVVTDDTEHTASSTSLPSPQRVAPSKSRSEEVKAKFRGNGETKMKHLWSNGYERVAADNSDSGEYHELSLLSPT
ncbi:N-acetylglucosamine-1-phosphodiester alpha-N-acetylglucosaminidase-like, partial [Ciona intestinalis]